jgi:predicted HAD superfamily Cof-like phosphohydrolase
MSEDNQDMITSFHRSFGLPVVGSPSIPDPERIRLRKALLREEAKEAEEEFGFMLAYRGMDEAQSRRCLAALAKELADVLVVTYGAAAEFGIDLDAVLREVHHSNMSKLDHDGRPIHRDDGKVLKGPNYQAPDIERLLFP